MGKIFSSIQPQHREFISKQKMFFVGSAPLQSDGHVNISPKGYDALRIISPNEVAYLDLTGSGNETSAHLEENGRITFMFMAVEGPPMIIRLYGKGQVILPESTEWNELIGHFDYIPGARQIIFADIHSVKTSCGFGIPFYSYEGERDTLKLSNEKKAEGDISVYHLQKNAVSMDGIMTPLGKQLQLERG
ncbi:pyridoxamine 5'-phosphate oxidase family protein [Bacillus gobiensis]|uniref:pyridoxamine 5'-phosphate oxidase family protein n=1 Tax=Bacillus gobiensis TaxID=1441095 RepID=UPI003D1AAB09